MYTRFLIADTILVTGAAGFIGGHVVKYLLENGHSVIALDTLFSIPHQYAAWYEQVRLEKIISLQQTYPDNFKIFYDNLVDYEKLEFIFVQNKIDKVCHLAGLSNVRYSLENPILYVAYNIEGTINLLSLMNKYHVNHIVMASSSSVYGEHAATPFIESDNTETMKSSYAISKKAMELYGSLYYKLYGINVTCLRLFTVYGPYGRMDMAPFLFVDAINQGKDITIMGDGSAKRDFTFISDVVQAFIKALERPLGFKIFNIGSGSVITINEFISLIETITHKKASKIYQQPHQGDVDFTHANIQNAQCLLDYQPLVSCYKGLQHLNDWYKAMMTQTLFNKTQSATDQLYDEYE